MVSNPHRCPLPASPSLSIQSFFSKSFPCFWCNPGQLVEESVSIFRHWSWWRRWSWHRSQVCRGERLTHTLEIAQAAFWRWKSSYFFSASGRSQHDRVGQRCDRQRRPSFRHRSPSHCRGWSNPETIAGPLRWSAQVLYLPNDAADSRTVVSGGVREAARQLDGAFPRHPPCLLSDWRPVMMFSIGSGPDAGFTFVNIPKSWTMSPRLSEI